ncbi:uncharacterized protein PFL1_01303 [Pseudozyma flocculosa PF-1]|uniref:J domain-containing protein n=1 Tax=Pseudozyma flocculosa TaxID=84751 RepID=A0A5C3EX60_9BASI|nr:uncharacterized protein PFL1_01303 [Pseudozyma flocculosa PF-1]EPQ31114.1 hypothetical protein PFL1_01303 [Pseudozyma flocculosa PF-1]SPO35977.1 uncharacterized protein PSFLO_01448 [Pseudozyma flocculosa]
MAPPAAATVEDFDDDDPYAPYRPSSQDSSSTTSSGPQSSPDSASPRSDTRPSASSASASASHSPPSSSRTPASSGAQRPAESSRSSRDPESGTQRSRTSAPPAASQDDGEEDDEPLFGGRPFRDAHDPTKAGPSHTSDPVQDADKEGLYALLNVDKEATEEQIKDAYRSLAVVLHPDKHQDAVRKAAAESRFREVQRAYETLIDREKRAVYDHFGEEGLKSSWTVSLRGRTPAEMQAEFERESRRRQAADAENLVKSKGDFTAHIDATALFARPERIPRPKGRFGPVTLEERINRVGCTQLIGKHGFDTQVTNTTSLNLSGQMVSRGGMGGGNLVGTVKAHWSPRLFSEVTMTFIRPHILTTKGQYTLDQNSFFTWQSTLQTLASPPTLNLTYGQRLSSKSMLTGFTSIRSGTYTVGPWGKSLSPRAMFRREPPVASVGLTKQVGEGKGWTVQTSISEVDQSIGADWATKVLGGVKVRVGFNLGTGSGLSAFTNGERRLTEAVRLSLGLNFGVPGGVTLRVRVNRLGQKVMVPIQLSSEFRSDLVILFAALPAAGYTALHHLYLQPRKRRRITDKLAHLRRDHAEVILQRRTAAIEACEVLRDQALKKAEAEMRKGGLVIVEAWYGRREAFPPPLEGSEEELGQVWKREREHSTVPAAVLDGTVPDEVVWDVRIPLQALVNKGQIVVPGGRPKSNILGFHDPVMGEKKHLKVRYLFRGQLHETCIEDASPLAAPLRAHQL